MMHLRSVVVLATLLAVPTLLGQEIAVVGVVPAGRSIGAATDTGISITFDRAVDRGSITGFAISGR